MADTQKNTLSGNGGKLSSTDMDREIAALKDDMARISRHVSSLLSATGNEAARKARSQMRRARSSVDDAISGAGEMGSEAADAMLEVRDTVADTIEEAVHDRPLTTLAMALAAGFVIGALWRR